MKSFLVLCLLSLDNISVKLLHVSSCNTTLFSTRPGCYNMMQVNHNPRRRSLWWVFTWTLLFGHHEHCWNKYCAPEFSTYWCFVFLPYKMRSQVWDCWDGLCFVFSCHIAFPIWGYHFVFTITIGKDSFHCTLPAISVIWDSFLITFFPPESKSQW